MTSLLLFAASMALGQPLADSSVLAFKQLDPSELRPIYGVRWKADIGTFRLLALRYEQWTRPLISEDGARVYVANSQGLLEAYALQDGAVVWRRDKIGDIGSAMLEHRQRLYVGVDSDFVALEALSGKELWRFRIGGRIGGADLVRTGTVAIVPIRPNGFVAIDLENGQPIWQVRRNTPDGLTVRGQARATVDRGRNRAYLGFSDGSLLAVDLDEGQTRWTVNLGAPSEFFADVDTAPVLLEGGKDVLVAAYNSGLFRLNAETGATVWTQPILRIIALEPTARGVIAASHGDGQVLGLDPRKGRIVWRYRMAKGAPSVVRSLPGDRLAVTSSEGPMAILSSRDGRPLQLVASGPGSSVPPAVSGRDLVLFSNGGLILALREGAGSQVLLH